MLDKTIDCVLTIGFHLNSCNCTETTTSPPANTASSYSSILRNNSLKVRTIVFNVPEEINNQFEFLWNFLILGNCFINTLIIGTFTKEAK